MASKPKILQESIELAKSLMDQKVRAYADRQADNKRRMDNNSRDNNAQQPSYKRQNVARAYFARPSEKKEYTRTLPLCSKYKFYHNGPCTVTCVNCKKVGHLTKDCRSPTAANNQRTLTCFECGNQGHYRSECPKLKNQNRGNQAGNGEARGREIEKNAKNELWEFYVNERAKGTIGDLDEYKEPCKRKCSDTFYKPHLDAQEAKDIYEVINREYSPIPIPARHDIDNPNKLCRTEEFTVVRNSIGNDEEFVIVGPININTIERTPDSMSCIYHELFNKKDRGWEVTRTKLRNGEKGRT
ncbi:reverse transcriptase domain-containing protein [Tanacetum coccineum]|uniref:Reverse transcriptase domain-containing protein n=1 Tax=Tanacetum coccineum TaxID=301880 RepID=A0ABQ5AWE2_9ASTR